MKELSNSYIAQCMKHVLFIKACPGVKNKCYTTDSGGILANYNNVIVVLYSNTITINYYVNVVALISTTSVYLDDLYTRDLL